MDTMLFIQARDAPRPGNNLVVDFLQNAVVLRPA